MIKLISNKQYCKDKANSNKRYSKDKTYLKKTILQGCNLPETNDIGRMQLFSNKQY